MNASTLHIKWGRLTGSLALFSALALSTACSALLSSSDGANQCSTNADCDAIGITGGICNAGICQAPNTVNPQTPVTVAEPDAGAPGCESDDQCTQMNAGRPSRCL